MRIVDPKTVHRLVCELNEWADGEMTTDLLVAMQLVAGTIIRAEDISLAAKLALIDHIADATKKFVQGTDDADSDQHRSTQ